MSDLDALVAELTTLRRGRGIEEVPLRNRIGPILTNWFQLDPTTRDRDVRQQVRDSIERLIASFTDDDRLAVTVGLGMAGRFWYSRLHKREEALAQRLGVSERTARRRVDHAFRRLAEEMAGGNTGSEAAGPDTGWTVRRVRVLVRLDDDVPELSEERTIVADRNDLRQITAQFTVPRLDQGVDGERRIEARANGVIIERTERLGQRHFRLPLTLPRTLSRGDTHTYGLTFRILDGQPIRASCVFVPLVDCESFEVTVRFHPQRLPRVVWRLDGVAYSLLGDPSSPGPALPLDGAHEVHESFVSLKQGYGYGLRWVPATGSDVEHGGVRQQEV